MLETRYLSPSDITTDAARRLLEWLLARGADEFTVAVMALEGVTAPLADAFEDALDPFALPVTSRRMPGTAEGTGVNQKVRRWLLTADSLSALLEFLPGGLFESPTGPSGWLEDLAVYRGEELLLGVVTHEREGVLRLTPAEHAAVRSLGISSSPSGESIGY